MECGSREVDGHQKSEAKMMGKKILGSTKNLNLWSIVDARLIIETVVE